MLLWWRFVPALFQFLENDRLRRNTVTGKELPTQTYEIFFMPLSSWDACAPNEVHFIDLSIIISSGNIFKMAKHFFYETINFFHETNQTYPPSQTSRQKEPRLHLKFMATLKTFRMYVKCMLYYVWFFVLVNIKTVVPQGQLISGNNILTFTPTDVWIFQIFRLGNIAMSHNHFRLCFFPLWITRAS